MAWWRPRAGSFLSKVVASVGVVGVAAAVAGAGTYGSFTSITSVDDTLTAGTVKVRLGTAGTADNRLTVAFAGGVPGDSMQRVTTLTNTGTQDFGGVTVTTTTAATPNVTTPSTQLTTDTINGLQITIDACSVPWTETGTAPAFTYTCSGTTAPVLAHRPIIGADLVLSNLQSLTTAKADNLRVTATLPTTANNDFQALTASIDFAFTATQRAATNR